MRKFKVSVPQYEGYNAVVAVEAQYSDFEDEILVFKNRSREGGISKVAGFSKWDYYLEVTDE